MAKDISLSPVQKGNASHRIITSANLPLFLKLNTLIINHKTFFFPSSSWFSQLDCAEQPRHA